MSDILFEAMKRAGWGNTKVKKNSGQSKTSKKKKTQATLTEQKTEAEVRKIKIGNEKEINNLVLRTLTRAILESVGHSIQTNFIDLPRRESATIAAMVGVPEKERIIEKYLSEKIQDAVMSLKTQIAEKVTDRSFE
ncbi:hypothetical protein LCGC14_1897420 [marine sediment metagenome]|uniref:Uncharacterized protein n=1 Tax=marine sediment metagenome TaxID=412755 RepID=A0A0F9IBF7_9ZZZZ